jgi:hypothetical protein
MTAVVPAKTSGTIHRVGPGLASPEGDIRQAMAAVSRPKPRSMTPSRRSSRTRCSATAGLSARNCSHGIGKYAGSTGTAMT